MSRAGESGPIGDLYATYPSLLAWDALHLSWNVIAKALIEMVDTKAKKCAHPAWYLASSRIPMSLKDAQAAGRPALPALPVCVADWLEASRYGEAAWRRDGIGEGRIARTNRVDRVSALARRGDGIKDKIKS